MIYLIECGNDYVSGIIEVSRAVSYYLLSEANLFIATSVDMKYFIMKTCKKQMLEFLNNLSFKKW